jgi:hypothetical protein
MNAFPGQGNGYGLADAFAGTGYQSIFSCY